MINFKQRTKQTEPEINLLEEWLAKINEENRAYIKGAARALLYVQDIMIEPNSKIVGEKK